jgi:hypothetical protein
VRLLAGCGRFKVGCRKFTDWARRQARLLARVLIKSSLLRTASRPGAVIRWSAVEPPESTEVV